MRAADIEGSTSMMNHGNLASVAAHGASRSRVVATFDGIEVSIGDLEVIALPAGQIGQIFMQRDTGSGFVDIPGAASAADVGYYIYTIQAADVVPGVTLQSRIINVSADTVSPRRHATAVYMATPDEVWVEYNKELLTGVTFAASQFTLAGTVATAKTVPSVSVAGNIVKIKASSAYVPGDAPTLRYVPSATVGDRVKDYAGNEAPAFGFIRVFNEFPEPATPAVLYTGSTNMAVGSGGFVKDASNPGGFLHWLTLDEFGTHGSQPAILTVAGWAECQVIDTDATLRVLGMKTDVAGNHISTLTWQARITGASVRPYEGSTAVGSTYTFPSPGTACRVRLYRDVPSGEIRLDTSTDAGVSWVNRWTYTTVSDLEIEGSAFCYSESTVVPIVGCALQGFKSRGF